MNLQFLRIIFVSGLIILFIPEISYADSSVPLLYKSNVDTLPEDQHLFNGRIWQNLYSQTEGDQFLFSDQFLSGSITSRGKKFNNILIRYDIFKDEIQIPYKPFGIIQINKELTDSFSLFFMDREYRFLRITDSTSTEMSGYYNELYNGGSRLLVRYIKKIEKYADGGRIDRFYQTNRIFLVRKGKFVIIKGKKDILNIFPEDKNTIGNYIKRNKIKILRDYPESYIPVLKFIDSLSD
jgi:hypothetical protein